MKPILACTLMTIVVAASPARAQLKLDLDGLAAKAKESVQVSLDANMLKLAGAVFSNEKKDEAKVKELISKLKGIQVRTFEFENEGAYSQADLQPIREQLKGPGWSRIVSVAEKSESVDIYVKSEGGHTAGLAILAAEPKELSIVSIDGAIDLEQLGALGGRFGIPAVALEAQKQLEKKQGKK